ncbi:MAG: hypothetical protein MI924_38335 [Chloroflexales bacterium]|nr:hypothetical protein [Chloroflexales bacterium]
MTMNDAKIQLTGRVALVPASGQSLSAHVAMPVLGGAGSEAPPSSLPFTDFVPAEAPVALTIPLAPHPPAAVLGAADAAAAEQADQVGQIQLQPDPSEAAAYILVQEIETPDGIVYDITLPRRAPHAAETDAVVLGGGVSSETLVFPVHRIICEGAPPAQPEDPAVLGGFGIGEIIGDIVFKRTLHLLRAPVAPVFQQFMAARENQPQVLPVGVDGGLGGPLEGFESWRARFEPGRPQRVLLFVHGFMSNADNSLPREWIKAFAPHYDAILAYNHPTISVDPFENAGDLLAQIPDDLRLHVDLLAHSRGGLVVRSLVELQEQMPKFNARRLLTCGSPHAGTLLANYEQWDRLVSIGMTAASWALSATGVAAPLAFVPKLVEYLLRAGGQFYADLPGAAAMIPDGAFLGKLNAPDHVTLAERVPYAVVTSAFKPESIPQVGFRTALTAMVVQAFMGAPNDLVVQTNSMSKIDSPIVQLPADRVWPSAVDHFSYFEKENAEIRDFAGQFFLSG